MEGVQYKKIIDLLRENSDKDFTYQTIKEEVGASPYYSSLVSHILEYIGCVRIKITIPGKKAKIRWIR